MNTDNPVFGQEPFLGKVWNPRDRPIFGFHWYIAIRQNGQSEEVLTKHCYIHASRQLVQESTTNQVKTVVLQQR